MKIVIDIETTAVEFDSLADSQKEFILRYAEKEKDEGIRKEKRAGRSKVKAESSTNLTNKTNLNLYGIVQTKSDTALEKVRVTGFDGR